jgi:O-antigen ligase
VTGVREGIEIMADEPLGRGLATGAGGGQAAAGQGAISQSSVFVPEDQWLQIGTQLGVLGLAIYVGALILMLRRLRPRGQLPDDQDANTCAGGARIALVGILAGGLFLQPFIEPVISWTVFALCGLAVGAMDQTATDTGKQPRVLTTLPMILANLRTSV